VYKAGQRFSKVGQRFSKMGWGFSKGCWGFSKAGWGFSIVGQGFYLRNLWGMFSCLQYVFMTKYGNVLIVVVSPELM